MIRSAEGVGLWLTIGEATLYAFVIASFGFAALVLLTSGGLGSKLTGLEGLTTQGPLAAWQA